MAESDNNNDEKKCIFDNKYVKCGIIGTAVIGIGGCIYYYLK